MHRYDLPLPLGEVWALISEVSEYRTWWPWLRVFEAAALAESEHWRCEVQPPVPYPVRFRVEIEHVEAPVLVHAKVRGDVVGDATLTLEEGVPDVAPRSGARSPRATGPSSWSPVSPARSHGSAMTGSSIREPVSSSPAPSSPSWATRTALA